MPATFSKLRNGSWGIRTAVPATAGQIVTVVKRDGGTKTVTIERVLWTGDGIALCAIIDDRPASSSRVRNVCAECGRGGPLVSDLEDGMMKHYSCCDIPPG